MKGIFILMGVVCYLLNSHAQVGIGTAAPNSKSILDLSSNSKGLLLPRMSAQERTDMSLTANDAGMMVYQNTSPKGVYLFDGSSWKYIAPVLSGTDNGHTLRWNGTAGSWVSEGNFYNGGAAIGVGTYSLGVTPTEKMHFHSGGANSRIRFTTGSYNPTIPQGLYVGVLSGSGNAQILHAEAKPILIGTNNTERLRIDENGNVGINQTIPGARLDVNGTTNITQQLTVGGNVDVSGEMYLDGNLHTDGDLQIIGGGLQVSDGTLKVGSTGTPLTGIFRVSSPIDLPELGEGVEVIANVELVGAAVTASVLVSPGSPMSHIMIEYARVSVAGNIEIKFVNMGPVVDTPSMMFYITVIQ